MTSKDRQLLLDAAAKAHSTLDDIGRPMTNAALRYSLGELASAITILVAVVGNHLEHSKEG